MTLNEIPVLSQIVQGVRQRVEQPVMTPSSSSMEAAFAEQHFFSADVATDYFLGTTVQSYWSKRPLSIPEQAAYRKLYFGVWFDGLATVEISGGLEWSQRGSAVLYLPFRIRREAATLVNSYGLGLPASDVWRLTAADTDFVVPSSGAAAADAIVCADTRGSYRYLTTLFPRHIAISADRVELRLTNWNVSATAGAAGFIHLAVQSQSRAF